MTAEGKGADRPGRDDQLADNGRGRDRRANEPDRQDHDDHNDRGDHDAHDGHDDHDAHDGHDDHDGHDGHDHREHHRRMIADFRRRFTVSLVVTLPILALSPTLQDWFGFSLGIPFQMPVLAVLATVVFLVVGGELRGALALDDVIRETSRDAVAALKERGIRCILLTGDNQAVAERVAAELGIDEVRAEVLPDEKADVVRSIRESTGAVAMVGDGVNDAPALAAADLGLAIGAGTDVAVEAADVVLVRDDPADVARVIALSEKVRSKMIQNLIWATGYNVVAIPLAAGVLAAGGILLSPAVGAVLMSASTVIVAVNARLMSEPESPAESG